ncbi:MAG: methylenetetrahydrofolate reductase [NAD(P)H] [Acutalibacteraceae bacterium]
MRIDEMFKKNEVTMSFEVFPPKTDSAFDSVLSAVNELAGISPAYMSVTYGAGGGTSKNTVKIATHIQQDLGITALAHLTCVSSSKQQVSGIIDQLEESGITNVLALRGDIPKDTVFPEAGHYKYAYQLIEEIKSRGRFCIGAACYPEGHVESVNKDDDLDYLKAKVETGCDFLVTQMFFDNNVMYTFLYNAMRKGIDIPVTAGIMPLTNIRQINTICDLAGTPLPTRFKAMVDKFADKPEALKHAGIVYATEQIIDLIANGVKGIHLYTMNKPDVAKSIVANLSGIID